MTVYGDLFARWDNTRWRVDTELVLPFRLPLNMELNKGFATQAVQMETVFLCAKSWKLGPKSWEVDCTIEDFALRSVVRGKKPSEKLIASSREVLAEIDERLTGARIQIQVSDDGRVTNFDLEGLSKDNRRLAEMHEVQRQLMRRVLVGFHMKLRKGRALQEGKWHEYNSEIMSIPVPPELTASAGSSTVVHYLNHYQGHVLVQSIGEAGMFIDYGGGREVNYKARLDAVAIFDPVEGFMTERVWSLKGTPSAAAIGGPGYWHAGKIVMLDKDTVVKLGPTAPISPEGRVIEGLEAWKSMTTE